MPENQREIYHLQTEVGCFWIAQQPFSSDWYLGVIAPNGISEFLGAYHTAQGAAWAVFAGSTGWRTWDTNKRVADVPDGLHGWCKGTPSGRRT